MAGMTVQQAVAAHMAEKPFIWGRTDCCLAACDVLVAIGLPDPARRFRGACHDAAGAAEILQARGSLIATVMPEFAALGWFDIRPEQAVVGDVGVVMVPGQALAVFDGDLWCVKTQRGVLRRRTAVAAWATGYMA